MKLWKHFPTIRLSRIFRRSQRKMDIPIAVLIFCLSILRFRCDGQPCTTKDASMLNVTKFLLSEFAEIPETDEIRRGEAVFNREQAKLIITKDYGFLVDEPLIRVKSLIKTWISKGFWDGSDAENDWRIFNSTLSRKAKYSFFNQRFNPSLGTWNSYQFIGDGTSDGRLSAAYAFLNLKCKGNHVTMTNTESDDLGDFVVYKNFKNFNKELASELARFSIKYDQCRSVIQSA